MPGSAEVTTMNTPNRLIYADANASARLRPEVATRVAELFTSDVPPGNPSSVHSSGQRSRALIRQARSSLLRLLNCGAVPTDQTLVFTSGATEGANLLIRGFVGAPAGSKHIVCSSVEHPAVLEPIRTLAASGCSVTHFDPNPKGHPFNMCGLLEAVTPQTQLVALMLANNETGRVYPVAEVCLRLREDGYTGAIISDATQALAKLHFSAADLFNAGLDGLVVSSHKIGGPTGVGAVALSKDSERCRLFEPQILGGNQEFGFRAGTENVSGIVGFGLAAEIALTTLAPSIESRSALRELLWSKISANYPKAVRLTPQMDPGSGVELLCNTLLVAFPGWRGDDLVVALDLLRVCCSSGAACSSGKQGISHVLNELNLPEDMARSAVRFSLDWDATDNDVETIVDRLNDVLSRAARNTSLQTVSESHAIL